MSLHMSGLGVIAHFCKVFTPNFSPNQLINILDDFCEVTLKLRNTKEVPEHVSSTIFAKFLCKNQLINIWDNFCKGTSFEVIPYQRHPGTSYLVRTSFPVVIYCTITLYNKVILFTYYFT